MSEPSKLFSVPLPLLACSLTVDASLKEGLSDSVVSWPNTSWNVLNC